MQNLPPICGPSDHLFFPQNAHSISEASSDDAQLTPCARKLEDSKRGSEKHQKAFQKNCRSPFVAGKRGQQTSPRWLQYHITVATDAPRSGVCVIRWTHQTITITKHALNFALFKTSWHQRKRTLASFPLNSMVYSRHQDPNRHEEREPRRRRAPVLCRAFFIRRRWRDKDEYHTLAS